MGGSGPASAIDRRNAAVGANLQSAGDGQPQRLLVDGERNLDAQRFLGADSHRLGDGLADLPELATEHADPVVPVERDDQRVDQKPFSDWSVTPPRALLAVRRRRIVVVRPVVGRGNEVRNVPPAVGVHPIECHEVLRQVLQ